MAENEVRPVDCGCGGTAIVREGRASASWWVECSKCGISTLWAIRSCHSRADAIRIWNRAMGRKDK